MSLCSLEDVLRKYGHYEKDQNYVFKLVNDECLVIMKKCDDTKTNESRSTSNSNKNYAKFRANKLHVEKISRLTNSLEEIKTVTNMNNSLYSVMNAVHDFVYATDTVAEVSNYDEDVETVCSTGIHYFKTIEGAYFWNRKLVGLKYTGIVKIYHDNGDLYILSNYVNGTVHGQHIVYHLLCALSVVQSVTQFSNNKEHGLYVEYDRYGNIKRSCTYVEGRRIDDYTRYDAYGFPIVPVPVVESTQNKDETSKSNAGFVVKSLAVGLLAIAGMLIVKKD